MNGCHRSQLLCLACFRHVLILSFLLSLAGFAQQPEKPRCNAEIRGQFWPDEANHNPKIARTLAKTGKLELCTVRTWRHRWEPVTVTLSDLIKKRDQRNRAKNGGTSTSD